MTENKDFEWDSFRKELEMRKDKVKQERERANDSVKRENNLGKKKK